jgi:hypothetical protein
MKWKDVGPLIGLTYAERETFKLYALLPCDVPEDEVRRRQADKTRRLDAERRRREREEVRKEKENMRTANDRGEAVLRMLQGRDRLLPRRRGIVYPPPPSYGEWTPVTSLVELAKGGRAAA